MLSADSPVPGEILSLLAGRLLALHEYLELCQDGCPQGNPELYMQWLEQLQQEQRVSLHPAISGEPPRCLRCGEAEKLEPFDCQYCKGDCLRCPTCAGLGAIRSCTTLIMGPAWEPPRERGKPPRPLTCQNSGERWDRLRQRILAALEQGQRVAVMARSGSRLEQMKVLLGADQLPGQGWAHGSWLFLTALQALRYRHAFDLVVVAESDDSGDLLSGRAARRCVKDGGAIYSVLDERLGEAGFLQPRWIGVPRLWPRLAEGRTVAELYHLRQRLLELHPRRVLLCVPHPEAVFWVFQWWKSHFPEQPMGHMEEVRHPVDMDLPEKEATVLIATGSGWLHLSPAWHVVVLHDDEVPWDETDLMGWASLVGSGGEQGELWWMGAARSPSVQRALATFRRRNRARNCRENDTSKKRNCTREEEYNNKTSFDILDKFRLFSRFWMKELYPALPTCPFCHQSHKGLFGFPGGEGICEACKERLPLIARGEAQCLRCGRPGVQQLCTDCQQWRAAGAALQLNRSALVYEDWVRQHWSRYKFQGERVTERYWCQWFCEGFERLREDYGPQPFDLLLPVPLSPLRLQERGFNQSLVLSRALSSHTGIPLAEGLVCSAERVKQSRRGRKERLRVLQSGFSLLPEARDKMANRRVLLVDDIYTTGSTLEACARLLREAGAVSIASYTLARSPGVAHTQGKGEA